MLAHVPIPSIYKLWIMKRILVLLMAVATLSCMAQKKPVNPDVYYARRATLFDLLPVYSSDIIMLGNSLTSAQDMPDILAELTGAEVVCHTRGGARLSEHLNPNTRLGARTQAALAKEQWDYVVLQEMSHGPITAPGRFFASVERLCVSAASIVSAMTQVVTTIQARCPKTEIYVQSMLPFNNDVRLWKLLKGREQVVVDGNKGLESMCQRLGVTFINLYPLFVGENGKMKPEYTNDGLHLMGGAYLIWRDALLPYIRK